MKYISVYLNLKGEVTKKTIEDNNIIAQNDKFIVLDDYCFTKIEKIKDKHSIGYYVLNTVNISDYTNDSYWKKYYGDFAVRLYTDIEDLSIIEKKLTKEFNKWLREKVSRYSGAFNKVNIVLKDE